MGITISNHVCVRDRAISLGYDVPEALAILPTNFESAQARSDLLLPSEGATVRALFRGAGLPLSESFFNDARYVQNNSFDWFAPTIFIAAGLVSENSSLVSVALGVLSNYISDLFKGVPGKRNVKISLVVERNGDRSCKKIEYEGDLKGLEDIISVIQKVADDRQHSIEG